MAGDLERSDESHTRIGTCLPHLRGRRPSSRPAHGGWSGGEQGAALASARPHIDAPQPDPPAPAPPSAWRGRGAAGGRAGGRSSIHLAPSLLGTAPHRCGLRVDVSREEEDGACLCSDGTHAGRTCPPDFGGRGQPAYVANIPSQSGSNLLRSLSKRLKIRFAPTWSEPSTQPNRR